MLKKTALIAVMAAMLAGPALAQIEIIIGREPVGTFWYHAPTDLHQRIMWLDNRMLRMRNDGHLAPGEYDNDHHSLAAVHADLDRLIAHDGGQISPADRDIIWHRLQDISARLHWQNTFGY